MLDLASDGQALMSTSTSPTPISIVQEHRIFEIDQARYLAEPLSRPFHIPGFKQDSTRVSLLTIIAIPSHSQEGLEFLRQTILKWAELDDVFRPEFLGNVLLILPNRHSNTDTSPFSQYLELEWRSTWVKVMGHQDMPTNMAPGPYVIWKGQVCTAFRLHEDRNLAFTVAVKPRVDKSGFANVRLSGEFYSALSVAVPTRVSLYENSHKPLAGFRFAVKDIFDIEGIRVTAGCRAYFDLSQPASATAPALQILIDKGADLIGTLKLGSLITREEPTESVDYHAAFNPRGDGYQSAWSSSGGSGSAIASYDWLDFTIATDTTGSSRRPALANGIFQHRLSKHAASIDGIVPSWKPFDSPAVFGRDLLQFEKIIRAWTGLKNFRDGNRSVTLIYPTDFWPVDNTQQMDAVTKFTSDWETTFNTKAKEVCIADQWIKSRPCEAQSSSIQEYLKDVGINSFCYGVYHELDEFRQGYRSKFGRDPYVNPVMQWRWDAAKNVTKKEHDDAVRKLDIYRKWFFENVMRQDDDYTVLLLPITTQAVDYRDVPPPPPGPPNAFDGIWLAPTLGAPELSLPIGEMGYNSRVSGNREFLPIVISILGSPGSDIHLISSIRKVLMDSGRPCSVCTGSRLFKY